MSVVGTSDKRPGLNAGESFGFGFSLQSGEFLGRIIAGDGSMGLRRLEVLADRQ
jgi:hypothetical protein